jgi:hypothetical protein
MIGPLDEWVSEDMTIGSQSKCETRVGTHNHRFIMFGDEVSTRQASKPTNKTIKKNQMINMNFDTG